MIMKGQKRKFPPEDVEVADRSSPTWESQRQFVFSVSLSKYQRGQELAEPSLRRSVLIANTLREISREACGEAPSADGPLQARELEGSFAGAGATRHHPAVADGHPALAGCPPASSNYWSNCGCPASCTSNVPPSAGDEEEDWGSMSTDPDFSLSAAISSILTALDSTIDGGPQAAPRPPLRSLENLSRPAEGSAAWAKQGVRGHGGSCGWEPQEGSVEAARCGYLSDLTVEDLFQDIDTSLLERDMGVLGLRGSGGGYPAGDDLLRYLPPFSPSSSPSSAPSAISYPFSLSLSQNLKCLPSFSSFSPSSSPALSSPLPSSSSSFSSPSSSPFSSQRDGIELEHLMEILVES